MRKTIDASIDAGMLEQVAPKSGRWLRGHLCEASSGCATLFFFKFDQAFGDWRTWFVVCVFLRLWWLLCFLFLSVVVFLVLAAASP